MLAQRHPEDVGKALIVDALPFYGALFGPDATPASVEPRAAAFRDAIIGMSDEAYRAQQPATIASMVMTEAARPPVIADALASDRRVVALAIYEDMITDVRPALSAIRVPLTVIYPVNPVATEATYGALVRAGYAGANRVLFVPVEQSYHFVMLDRPDRFNDLLGAFLRGGERCSEIRLSDAGVPQPRPC
jgi:pimeloyl-ACP methyl ester carboxylesterase